MNRKPFSPYDSLCKTTGLVRGTPLFIHYIDKYIKPVLANLMLTPQEAARLISPPATQPISIAW